MSDFVVARNPDQASRLPYLLRLPLADGGTVILATSDTWPSGRDLFCYELSEWPAGATVLATVPVESCWRAGAAVHLILRRRQRRRSLFVWTARRDRRLIFWRSQVSMRAARPGIRVPQARGLAEALTVAVDTAERYPWRFARHAATTARRQLPVGDYAVVVDDACLAVVERKTVADLASSAASGGLALTMADLSQVPHAMVVVEGRLSDLVKAEQQGRVRPGWLLNVLAALQATHPRVPLVFAETRAMAEDYAYRWLAACVRGERRLPPLPGEPPAPPSTPTPPGKAPDTGPQLLDAVARRALAVREARAGTVWTTARLASRCGSSPATAAGDLRALVATGQLQAEGNGRARRYRAPDQDRPTPDGGPTG